MSRWDLVIRTYGTQVRAAAVAGVRQPALSQAIAANRRIPAEWARAWHDDAGIPLQLLRPDLWPAREQVQDEEGRESA